MEFEKYKQYVIELLDEITDLHCMKAVYHFLLVMRK